jgi:putative ABC transport system ATP-binding protein
MSNIIEIKELTKEYKIGGEIIKALDNISVNIEKGEFVAILGASGSGKSTLMNMIGLMDRPTHGQYFLDGQDVSKLKENQQAQIRNKKIGFVFQQFNLLARTSVLDNVLLPTIYGSVENREKKAKELIEMVGLTDRMKNKSNELSGGQIQRVAIARALIMNPSILLADEPTGNLDTKRSNEIIDIFDKLNKAGTTIVLITHESDIAARAQRVIRLVDGHVVSDAK